MFNNLTQHINIKHIINQNLIKELDFTNKYENEIKFLKSRINNYYNAKNNDLFSINYKHRNKQLQNQIKVVISNINNQEIVINLYLNRIQICKNKIKYLQSRINTNKIKFITIKFIKNTIINVNLKTLSVLNLKKIDNNQKIVELKKDLANQILFLEEEEKNLIAKLIEQNAKIVSENNNQLDEIRKKINLKQIKPIEKENMEFNLNILEEENNFLVEEEKTNIQEINKHSKEKQQEKYKIFDSKVKNIHFKNLLLDIKINGISRIIKRERNYKFKFAKYLNILKYKLFLEKEILNKYQSELLYSNGNLKIKFSKLNNIRNDYIKEIEKDQILYDYLEKNYNLAINRTKKQIHDTQFKLKMQNNLEEKIIKIIKNNPKLHLLILKNK